MISFLFGVGQDVEIGPRGSRSIHTITQPTRTRSPPQQLSHRHLTSVQPERLPVRPRGKRPWRHAYEVETPAALPGLLWRLASGSIVSDETTHTRAAGGTGLDAWARAHTAFQSRKTSPLSSLQPHRSCVFNGVS